mmetsp:Transcript_1808/g.4086  ORF Transcript_1808/g.4086 Transcript_1808/m.4086 type:complete len:620 (+) Transcript_1808:60-1919(+)
MPLSKADAALLKTVLGEWYDDQQSWYKVSRDGEEGLGDTASVQIWRYTGEKITRKGVIRVRPAADSLPRRVVWGRDSLDGTYHVDAASATKDYIYWQHNNNGRGFGWHKWEDASASTSRPAKKNGDEGKGGATSTSKGSAKGKSKGKSWEKDEWSASVGGYGSHGWDSGWDTKWEAGWEESQDWSHSKQAPVGGKGGKKAAAATTAASASATVSSPTVPATSSVSKAGEDAGKALLRSIGGKSSLDKASDELLRLLHGGKGASAKAKGKTSGQDSSDRQTIQTAWHPTANDTSLAGKQLLSVEAGDRVSLAWRQDAQEGGYWAYGESGGRSGYFPASCLKSSSSSGKDRGRAPGTFVGQSTSSAAVVGGGDGQRSSSKQSPGQSTVKPAKAKAKGTVVGGGSSQVTAVTPAIPPGRGFGSGSSGQNALPPPGSWRGPGPAPASTTAAPTSQSAPPTKNAAATPAPQHHQPHPGPAAGPFGGMAPPQFMAPGPTGMPSYEEAVAAQHMMATAFMHAQAQAAQAAQAAQMEAARVAQAQAAQVAAETHNVVQPWSPSGSPGSIEGQLALRTGDRVQVRWRQPHDAGGFWAYGALERDPMRLGYFPISCIARQGGSKHGIPL